MKLYLLENMEFDYYYGDMYDSIIVAADSEDLAKRTQPDSCNDWKSTAWASSPNNVKVTYIGEAAPNVESGVLFESFCGA